MTKSSPSNSKSSLSVWEQPWFQKIPDPTRIFSSLVITILIVRYSLTKNIPQGQSIGTTATVIGSNFFSALTTGFLLNPYVVTFMTMSNVCLYYALVQIREKNRSSTTGSTTGNSFLEPFRSLAIYERWTVEWYWWNSWLYHMTMDGASGSLRLVPVVVHQYDVLDLRFPNRHVVPWIIGMIELLIMGPLCMITAAAVLLQQDQQQQKQQHSIKSSMSSFLGTIRYPLELITSTLHITGMIIFVVAELYEGQLCIPALDPVGQPGEPWANVKFNLYHLTYYWFGFWFCNLIWGVVPLIRIRRAIMECHKLFPSEQQQQQTSLSSSTKKLE